MKEITFVVPCYNSQDYMKRCIDSLITCGEDSEILIIDDGSTDDTGEIADVYAALYPDIIRVIHKVNGGHGSGVNAGIQEAKGRFLKVVDSDDWLDSEALFRVMEQVRAYQDGVDMIVCNYVYNHLEEGRQKAVHYKNIFPVGRITDWNEMGRFHSSQYLVMHALIFRTEVLRKSGVKLPEHTFYVDNLFAYVPLPHVKKILYLNENLYHYYLGRDDQSVNEESYKKRIDQQILVTKMVAESVDLEEVKKLSPKLAKYMLRNISIMMTISSIYLLLIGSKEALEKRRVLWHDIREQNSRIYRKLRYRTLSGLTLLPGRVGNYLVIKGYQLAKKQYQFS